MKAIAIGVVVLANMSACGDDALLGEILDAAVTNCVPGDQKACPCAGGAQGVQQCRQDGTGFDPCLGCELADISVPSESGADTGVCAFDGIACPVGCHDLLGQPYDSGGECLGPIEVVACYGGGYDASTILTCRVNKTTGTLYRFGDTMAPLEPDVPGWTECSETDSEKVVVGGIPPCG